MQGATVGTALKIIGDLIKRNSKNNHCGHLNFQNIETLLFVEFFH